MDIRSENKLILKGKIGKERLSGLHGRKGAHYGRPVTAAVRDTQFQFSMVIPVWPGKRPRSSSGNKRRRLTFTSWSRIQSSFSIACLPA